MAIALFSYHHAQKLRPLIASWHLMIFLLQDLAGRGAFLLSLRSLQGQKCVVARNGRSRRTLKSSSARCSSPSLPTRTKMHPKSQVLSRASDAYRTSAASPASTFRVRLAPLRISLAHVKLSATGRFARSCRLAGCLVRRLPRYRQRPIADWILASKHPSTLLPILPEQTPKLPSVSVTAMADADFPKDADAR
jgi:hypothetical protein